MIRHTITIYYDATDGIYVAEIPELEGCATHGRTHEEALVNIKEAYASWTAAVIANGFTIPEPMKHSA